MRYFYSLQILNANTPGELTDATRQFCRGTCVATTFPSCANLDADARAGVDQIMQGKYY